MKPFIDLINSQNSTFNERIKVVEGLLLEAGHLISTMRGELQQEQIGHKDLVSDLITRADEASDQLIVKTLQTYFPHDWILTEESGLLDPKGTASAMQTFSELERLESLWIADPIDGTTNYVHQLEHYAICIAWMSFGTVLLSGMYIPKTDELFIAVKGEGAYRNRVPIKVSSTRELNCSLVGTGFCISDQGLREQHLKQVGNLADRTRGIRHLGSAACSLAKVACGQFDGFWIKNVKPWDVASGILLVEEAGGQIDPLGPNKSALQSGSLLATNGLMAKKLLEYID